MGAEHDYDTTNLNALRQELQQLNEAALKSGLIAPRDGQIVMPRLRPRRRRLPSSAAASDKASASSTKAKRGASGRNNVSFDAGKSAAARLIKLAGRIAGDKTLAVTGTAFTEGGVARLLAHLGGSRRRRARAWLRFRRQMLRFLQRPVSSGIHTVAGVSVERLQVVWRQLQEIEQNGWAHFQEKRAVRRLEEPAEPPPRLDRAPAHPTEGSSA